MAKRPRYSTCADFDAAHVVFKEMDKDTCGNPIVAIKSPSLRLFAPGRYQEIAYPVKAYQEDAKPEDAKPAGGPDVTLGLVSTEEQAAVIEVIFKMAASYLAKKCFSGLSPEAVEGLGNLPVKRKEGRDPVICGKLDFTSHSPTAIDADGTRGEGYEFLVEHRGPRCWRGHLAQMVVQPRLWINGQRWGLQLGVTDLRVKEPEEDDPFGDRV